MKKRFFVVLIAFLLVLTGCSTKAPDTTKPDSSQSKETTFEKAKRLGYVNVGFANEAPYAFATPDGKLTGEAPEISRVILQKLGIKEMSGVLTEFGSLIPSLKANRVDIITAGMFITADRAKEVDFANPEYTIGEAIAVKKDNPLKLKSYESIAANSKAKIAIMAGAIEYDRAIGVGVSKDQIVTVPDQPSALAALQAGRVDAITMTGPSLQAMLDAAKDASIERVNDFTQPIINGKSVQGYGAAAFRKEDSDFREAYNKELENLKKSGELLKILQKFGFSESEVPGQVTAEQAAGK